MKVLTGMFVEPFRLITREDLIETLKKLWYRGVDQLIPNQELYTKAELLFYLNRVMNMSPKFLLVASDDIFAKKINKSYLEILRKAWKIPVNEFQTVRLRSFFTTTKTALWDNDGNTSDISTWIDKSKKIFWGWFEDMEGTEYEEALRWMIRKWWVRLAKQFRPNNDLRLGEMLQMLVAVDNGKNKRWDHIIASEQIQSNREVTGSDFDVVLLKAYQLWIIKPTEKLDVNQHVTYEMLERYLDQSFSGVTLWSKVTRWQFLLIVSQIFSL
jgi:hypothetical protein